MSIYIKLFYRMSHRLSMMRGYSLDSFFVALMKRLLYLSKVVN